MLLVILAVAFASNYKSMANHNIEVGQHLVPRRLLQDGVCKDDAYYAIQEDNCRCGPTTCPSGRFCYLDGCSEDAGCKLRDDLDEEFFYGATVEGKWDEVNLRMNMYLPIPGDVNVKKIEWVHAQDPRALEYDPSDRTLETKWKVDRQNMCEPKYRLDVGQNDFFGPGSRFILHGTRMISNLKVTSEERVDMTIDGYTYSHMREMENTVPVMVELIQEKVVRAQFNTVFTEIKSIELDGQLSSIDNKDKFLKECNALLVAAGIEATCSDIAAKPSDKVGNIILSFQGLAFEISRAYAYFKEHSFKSPSYGPFQAIPHSKHHEFVFFLSAKESSEPLSPRIITIKMEIHSRVGIDHSVANGGVRVTANGREKIDEHNVKGDPFTWERDDKGEVKYRMEHNLYVETLTWVFSPKQIGGSAYNIPLEFKLAKNQGVFIAFAKVNVKKTDVLGYIGFTTDQQFYRDAACTQVATDKSFALQDRFYILIRLVNNPVDATRIQIKKFLITQLDENEKKIEIDLIDEKEKYSTVVSPRMIGGKQDVNAIVVGAKLDGTILKAKHEGWTTDIKIDLLVDYEQGAQKNEEGPILPPSPERRMLQLSFNDDAKESAVGSPSQHRAPDKKGVDLRFNIVPAREAEVGTSNNNNESLGASRTNIMAFGLGSALVYTYYSFKKYQARKESEKTYLLQMDEF